MPIIATPRLRDAQEPRRRAITPYRDIIASTPAPDESRPSFDGCIRVTHVFLIALCLTRAAADLHRATYTLEAALALGLAFTLTIAGLRVSRR